MKRVQNILLVLLLCTALTVAFFPGNCWSISYGGFYNFNDQFDDGAYTDKWTAALSGQASLKESGTLLYVALSAQPGSCAAATVTQKQSFNNPCVAEAVVVLRPAAGASAGVKLKKDAGNFVQLMIGPEDVVINNMESGRLATHVVGSAAPYAGRDTTVEISAVDYGSFTLLINGSVVGEVTNVQAGASGLSLELANGYCPSAPSTAHIFYDSVTVGTQVCYIAQRVYGRVTDSRTGEGIPFARVTSDRGGGGLTSPNGYYILGLAMETSLTITVAADGYSPAWGTIPISDLLTVKDWSLKPLCASAVSPQGAAFGPGGGTSSASVTMTTQAGCGTNWTAESSAAWIFLAGSGIGSGNGSVPYLIAANAGIQPRIGTISIAGKTVRIIQQGTQQMSVPSSQQIFGYAPVAGPGMEVDPSGARPFAAGDLSGGVVDMDVGLPGFNGPVDIYLGFKMPDSLSQEIWIVFPDLSAQPASKMVGPWKTGVTGPVYDGLYEEFPLSMLPPGTYYLYTLVTPAGRLDSYYLWVTEFPAP